MVRNWQLLAKVRVDYPGKSNGIITIWNVRELLCKNFSSSFVSDDNNKICELDDHAGCVNCVKWSPDGKYLASGGDDYLVIIWRSTKLKSIYEHASELKETWRAIFNLRSHTADVLDLQWSSSGEYLATCSVDSHIFIYNRNCFPSHSGFVKGIAWDPLGEFLASQSEDNTLKIWPISEIKNIKSNANKQIEIDKPEVVIKKPFRYCTPTTQFLRLDWSPDGQFLLSCHSLNNGGPVTKIIIRDTWSYARDLVGHRKAITCVVLWF